MINLLPARRVNPSSRDCSMFPAGFSPVEPKILRLRKLAGATQRKVELYWAALDSLAIANLQGGASTVRQCFEFWQQTGFHSVRQDMLEEVGYATCCKLHFLYAVKGWAHIWQEIRGGRI